MGLRAPEQRIAPPTTDLPSAGAWGLWNWAKTNPDRFYEQLLPKAMKERPVDTMAGVIEDPGIEEIEKMLAQGDDFRQVCDVCGKATRGADD